MDSDFLNNLVLDLSGGQKFSDWDVFDSIITQIFCKPKTRENFLENFKWLFPKLKLI